jgi:hypothetical protein
VAKVCKFMLESGKVKVEHCKAMLTATRHVPAGLLEKNLEILRRCFEDAFLYSPGADRYIKTVILSMIGLYNATKQFSYKQTQGYYEIDAGAGVKTRRRMQDGSFVFTSYTELLGLFSMAPWGRIALDVEQMRIAQITDFVARFPTQLSIVGAHVDGVFDFSHDFEQQRILSEIEDTVRFPDGSPMFKVKNEPVCKVPTWPQGDSLRAQEIKLEPVEWEEYQEWDVPDARFWLRRSSRRAGA